MEKCATLGKNAPHSKKCAALGKMGHSWKNTADMENAPHSKKCATNRKYPTLGKSPAYLKKCNTPGKCDPLEKMSLGKIRQTWKNAPQMEKRGTRGKLRHP